MEILKQIASAFAASDEQIIAAIPAEIQSRREAYAIHRTEMTGKHEEYQWYSKQGIESCQDSLSHHVEREIEAAKKKHADRNKRIAKKFSDVGIENIDSANIEIVYGNDFAGSWIIDGYRVDIEVIWAGGHNIQCLHSRVLCKIKKAA